MDKIFIRNLNVAAIIGTFPNERKYKQNLVLNIELGYDASKAGSSDDLVDALDYSCLEAAIINTVENSSFKLLEALAQAIADVCLEAASVSAVKVTVDKAGGAKRASSIGLEIQRVRQL